MGLEKIGKIGETRTLRCSQRGKGKYLFLPKDLVDIYGILAGDRIEVKLETIYRQRTESREGE